MPKLKLYNPRTLDAIEITAPENLFYTDFETGALKLSTYGKGYQDGATDAYFLYEKHPSIKIDSNVSNTRRAYVTGYIDGYTAVQNKQNVR